MTEHKEERISLLHPTNSESSIKQLKNNENSLILFIKKYIPRYNSKIFFFYFNSFLLIFFFIIFDVMSTLGFKKSNNLLFQYPFLSSQFNYFFKCIFFFIGHFVYNEIYYPYFYNEKNKFTKVHHLRIYSIHYFNISLLNIFESLFQIWGTDMMGKDGGSLMVIVAQLNIPFSALFTSLLFKDSTYHFLQKIGIAIIMVGVFIAIVLPVIVNWIKNGASISNSKSDNNVLFGVFLFIIGCIITVLERMYYQYLLNEKSVNLKIKRYTKRFFKSNSKIYNPFNIFTFGFYTCLFEFILNLIVMFPIYYFFIHNYNNFNEFIHSMNIAFNNILFSKDRYGALIYFTYCFVSYIWLMLRLACVKYINADITFFANALAFPFCTLVFVFPFLSFILPEQKPITVYDIISIFILFIGLICYGIGERREKLKKLKLEETTKTVDSCAIIGDNKVVTTIN